jgi:hypothetical protein
LAQTNGRFANLLDDAPDAEKLGALRAAEGVGRALGSRAFRDRVAASDERSNGG